MRARQRLAASLASLAAAAAMPGCLKRTIAITSDPDGALVWLNGVEVGRTPLEVDFTFYGTYDVSLRKEGYEPVMTTRVASPPLFEIPPIDALAEAIPGTHPVVVEWFFALVRSPESLAKESGDRAAREAAEYDLIARAQTLRNLLGGEPPAAPPPVESSPSAPPPGP
jgi:hypothetical protein